jgi:Flp pilus assembly protein TadG
MRARREQGATAVEFALLAILFFTLVFGILEIARLVYLFNTLQEVTRRAAALAINSPFDPNSQKTVREQAMLINKSGTLVLGAPVTPAHLKLEYLSLSRVSANALTTPRVTSLPADPAANRVNCLTNPYGASCIRFVRVRICQPDAGDGCTPVPYQMLFPLINLSGLTLPRSQTTVPAQNLGLEPGTLPGS